MTPSFQFAFNYVLGDEGRKYTNDPDDSGGSTKFGISKKAFEAYWKRAATDAEIENMTEQTAMTIYYYDYWMPLRLDDLTAPPMVTAIFDTAVLYSPKVSWRMAQQALRAAGRAIRIDGLVGEETIGLLNGISPLVFMTAYRAQILSRIADVVAASPKDRKFRDGWTNRANRLLALVPNPKQGDLT